MTTLVNSHLHFDHVGGNKLFTGIANALIHEQELAQARNHEPFEFFGYSDKTWDYEGAKIETISGDVELAHGALALRDARPHGRPLLAAREAATGREADAVRGRRRPTRRRRFEKGIQPGFHYDPVAGVRSIRASRTLAAEHGAEIFFSHDMDAWHDVQARARLLRALAR